MDTGAAPLGGQSTRVRQRGQIVEARLKIPNREVRDAYRTVFWTWLGHALGDGGRVPALARALLGGDAETAEHQLQTLMLRSLSLGPDLPPLGPELPWMREQSWLLR